MLNTTEIMVNSDVSNSLPARFAWSEAAAFDELASHHSHITNIVSFRLDSSDEADDLVQEVFLSALKNLNGFRSEGRLSSWLNHIAVNKCRSHWRKLSVRRKVLASAARVVEQMPPPRPETVAMDRETFSRVRQAVQALPRHYCQVVVLWYFDEIPTAEVAAALTISPAIVRLRLHRARRRLRGLLVDLVEE
ncbi:MAG: sigma-70 family RNA polymerase sigma factor [Phycisphaerae bacterium]|nr:sigma-70 family RNA polymerase sigma factor [Phycisphaerae bacterium]